MKKQAQSEKKVSGQRTAAKITEKEALRAYEEYSQNTALAHDEEISELFEAILKNSLLI